MEAYLKTEYPKTCEYLGSKLFEISDDSLQTYESPFKEMEAYLNKCPKCAGLDDCISTTERGFRRVLRIETYYKNPHLGVQGNYCKFELARQNQEKINSLLKSARIRKRFEANTIDNFEASKYNKAALIKARTFIENFNRDSGRGLMFVGPVGTGKTHLAVGVLKEIIKKGVPGACVTVPELLEDIKQSYRDKSNEGSKLLETVKTVPVLLLDDLGTEKVTEWVQETLFVIINARYDDMLPTLITSNCSPEDLEKRIGERSVSRLIEMCDGILLAGADWRKKKLDGEDK